MGCTGKERRFNVDVVVYKGVASMSEIEKRDEAALENLAAQINEEHRACAGIFRKALEHAIRAGELLTEAKEQCPHGEWLPWLTHNFEGAPRTAQDYMRLYKHRDELRAKTRDSAYLSMNRALKELTEQYVEVQVIEQEQPSEEQRVPIEYEIKYEKRERDREEKYYKLPLTEQEQERDVFEDLEEEMKADRRAAFKKMSERRREREEREREEAKKRPGMVQFMEVDGALSKQRKAARETLKLVRGVQFDDEAVEIFEADLVAVQETLELVGRALGGDTDTDWDAELFDIEQRYQWGDQWEDPPA
jgi:hypothetical protein